MTWCAILLSVLALCACAATPPAASDSWVQSSEQIHRLARAGQLTPLQEQERLRDAFVRAHGPEPEAMRFYAYTISLMRSAEDGTLSSEQARALIRAREQEVIAEREALERVRHRAGYDYQTN